MTGFAQALVSGLSTGGIYALVAVGIVLIFRVSGVLTLAQGDFLAVAGFIEYALLTLHIPLVVCCILSVVAMTALGLAMERLVIRPVRGAPPAVLVIITLGISFLLEGAMLVIWGSDPVSLPAFSGQRPVHLGGVAILPQSLWVLGGVAVTVAALTAFVDRTMIGKAMLATAQNRLAAGLVGISDVSMSRLAFGLSAAVAGVAGVLVAPITYVSYSGGRTFGLVGLVAATLGGLTSLRGAALGGLGLGLLEAYVARYGPTAYTEVVVFGILVVFLLVRAGRDRRGALLRAAEGRV